MSKDTDRLARAAARAITLTTLFYGAAIVLGLAFGLMESGR